VKIHDQTASDSPILPTLVDTTAQNFKLREVSADKGYLSAANVNAIARHDAVPFIALKVDSVSVPHQGDVWNKMFHYFSFNRDEFLSHYHKRSNIESTVMMIKAK